MKTFLMCFFDMMNKEKRTLKTQTLITCPLYKPEEDWSAEVRLRVRKNIINLHLNAPVPCPLSLLYSPQHTLTHTYTHTSFHLSSNTLKTMENQSNITLGEVAESAKAPQGVEKDEAKGGGGQTEQ